MLCLAKKANICLDRESCPNQSSGKASNSLCFMGLHNTTHSAGGAFGHEKFHGRNQGPSLIKLPKLVTVAAFPKNFCLNWPPGGTPEVNLPKLATGGRPHRYPGPDQPQEIVPDKMLCLWHQDMSGEHV